MIYKQAFEMVVEAGKRNGITRDQIKAVLSGQFLPALPHLLHAVGGNTPGNSASDLILGLILKGKTLEELSLIVERAKPSLGTYRSHLRDYFIRYGYEHSEYEKTEWFACECYKGLYDYYVRLT